MYAQLCKRLAENAPNFESPDSKNTTFKHLLLGKCQDEFKNRAALSGAYDKRAGKLTVDEEEAKFIAKRKMLGNIKFIGELGKLEMLHDSILHRCCEQLLVGWKKKAVGEQAEDMECLAYLFKTCGRILDSQKAKNMVDQYFERIRAIIANEETATRIKFLLQDVIEMRENRWMPRKLTTPDGPRTIQQVREDAARDGCIYLPQQDTTASKNGNGLGSGVPSHLQQLLFSKSRNKGMEDIFGGGPDDLGVGPGVIGAPYRDFDNDYGSGGGGGGGGSGGGPSFEEKFNASNRDLYNRDHHESRDHHRDSYKPKRDSFESKFAERPDFGDRFTANRNRTHPSNRGRGGRMNDGGMSRSSNGYDKNGMMGGGSQNGDKDLPPRFKKMGFGSGGGDSLQLRPSASMMLKPKTPSSLPKSAIAKPDVVSMMPGTTPVRLGAIDPPVFISKQSVDKKKQEKKKDQGPTREEVFGKIDELLKTLKESGSTNEAFTAWKEAEFPSKMVNNALIHMYKRIVNIGDEGQRKLALQLVEQLCGADAITQTHCREALARLISTQNNLEAVEGGLLDLAVWSVNTDQVKLAELAEMTEGGSTHPLFFNILQKLAGASENDTLALFKASEVKLLDQLPQALRTEEQLGSLLEEMKLSFLVPLLTIKAELWRQLESNDGAPDAFIAWIRENVGVEHQTDPTFIYALVSNLIRFIVERSGDQGEEKELILRYKTVLKTFLGRDAGLQLCSIYALQVYCFTNQVAKGVLLRWFVNLYEADIVEEQVFLKWKEDVNDTYPGKGKALFQVNQWLTWLQETETDDEEDDDE